LHIVGIFETQNIETEDKLQYLR